MFTEYKLTKPTNCLNVFERLKFNADSQFKLIPKIVNLPLSIGPCPKLSELTSVITVISS